MDRRHLHGAVCTETDHTVQAHTGMGARLHLPQRHATRAGREAAGSPANLLTIHTLHTGLPPTPPQQVTSVVYVHVRKLYEYL